jgi:hypothetical protein
VLGFQGWNFLLGKSFAQDLQLGLQFDRRAIRDLAFLRAASANMRLASDDGVACRRVSCNTTAP